MIGSFLKILAAIIQFILSPQYRQREKEKKQEKAKDDYDEALAENNFDHLSGDLSDSFDRVRSEVRRDPE